MTTGIVLLKSLMDYANEDSDNQKAQVTDDHTVAEDAALDSNSEHQAATKSQLQHLDHTHHAAIIEARSLGKSMKDIALIMHRSEHQIRRICKNHDKYGHLGPRPGSGRKRKTSTEEDDAILEEAARQLKNISGSTLHKLLGLKNISERTVRRRMKEHSAIQVPNVETSLYHTDDASHTCLRLKRSASGAVLDSTPQSPGQ